MKALLFLLAAALASAYTWASPANSPAPASSLSDISRAENVCLVRQAYAVAGSAAASDAQQRQAVQACVSFEQGTAAWYLRQHAARADGVDASSAKAQAFLVRIRQMSAVYLRSALRTCERHKADETACLARLQLQD